jgi:hypothetical protein
MADLGRTLISMAAGEGCELSYDGNPEWFPGGPTIDWSTVAALGADKTFADVGLVPAGKKALGMGQFMTQITASGKYGPYDPAASDGRQTITIGKCFVLNNTVLELNPAGLTTHDNVHRGGVDGGRVWEERLIQSGTATHTLALGPTRAELLAALPRLKPFKQA